MRSNQHLAPARWDRSTTLITAFGRLSFCSSRRIAYRAAPAPRRRPWSAQRRLRRPCAHRAGCDDLECGGHTFTLPCQLCERVRAAQFPIAIRTTRLQTNIGERTMRSRTLRSECPTAPHSKRRLRPSSPISSWTYSAKPLSAAALAPDRSILRNASQVGSAMARVTRHRRVAQRRNASPGCSAQPRLFIEFHLTREGLGGYWAEKLRSWTMRKSARFASITLSRIIFSVS